MNRGGTTKRLLWHFARFISFASSDEYRTPANGGSVPRKCANTRTKYNLLNFLYLFIHSAAEIIFTIIIIVSKR